MAAESPPAQALPMQSPPEQALELQNMAERQLQSMAESQLMQMQSQPAQMQSQPAQSVAAQSPPPQMKPGDWFCPQCGELQQAQNSSCRKCGTGNPDPMKSVAAAAQGIAAGLAGTAGNNQAGYAGNSEPSAPRIPKEGDWYCPGCHDLQFARNTTCRKCGMPNPNQGLALIPGPSPQGFSDVGFQPMPMKPGDWNCPACGDIQFARNQACRKCGTPNPDPQKTYNEMVAGMVAEHGEHRGVIAKPGDWFCPGCNDLQFGRNAQCRKCGTPNPNPNGGSMFASPLILDGGQTSTMAGSGPLGTGPSAPRPMKPGDWHCPACGDQQFARNIACRKCGQAKPPGASPTQKPGDWHCPNCNDLQFAKNPVCRRCQTPNPDPQGSMVQLGQAMASRMAGKEKPGDWYCPQCGDLQFARNTNCRKCQTPNPNPEAVLPQPSGYISRQKPGDWMCPKCGDLQFARNSNCRRCDTPNPDPDAASKALSSSGGGGFPKIEKPGDWYCPSCREHNFSRNLICRRCQTPNPDPESSKAKALASSSATSGYNTVEKPGDWHCPACGDLQFARNTNCRRCSTPNPNPAPRPQFVPPPANAPPPPAQQVQQVQQVQQGQQGQQKKPGDWHCVNCGALNFAQDMECKACGSPNFAAMVESQWGMKGGTPGPKGWSGGKGGDGSDGGKDGWSGGCGKGGCGKGGNDGSMDGWKGGCGKGGNDGSMDGWSSGKGGGKDDWTSSDDGWMGAPGTGRVVPPRMVPPTVVNPPTKRTFSEISP